MKRIFKSMIAVAAVSILVACNASSTKNDTASNASAGNSKIEFKIKDGTYIFPNDGSTDSKYLALNVEIKNKGSEKLSISKEDISLYDSEDEKVSSENVYDSEDNFKELDYAQLSKNKTISGYVVFEVNQDEKYELHYTPTVFSEDKVENNEVTLKVDASKYADNTDKITDVTKEYVDKVFLSGDASGEASKLSTESSEKPAVSLLADEKKSDKDKKDSKKDEKKDEFILGGEIEKDRSEFVKNFGDDFAETFTYYEPSEAEMRTFVEAYTKANAKRAKVTYTVKEYLPESAVIYVRPETIGLENIRTSELISKFADEHRGEYSNISDAYKAAEKYILEQAPSQFDTIPLVTGSSMGREGYELKLVKKSGKWVVDKSSDSSYYNSLMRAFKGNIY